MSLCLSKQCSAMSHGEVIALQRAVVNVELML